MEVTTIEISLLLSKQSTGKMLLPKNLKNHSLLKYSVTTPYEQNGRRKMIIISYVRLLDSVHLTGNSLSKAQTTFSDDNRTYDNSPHKQYLRVFIDDLDETDEKALTSNRI